MIAYRFISSHLDFFRNNSFDYIHLVFLINQSNTFRYRNRGRFSFIRYNPFT
jgi:hypothetical protein